MNDPLKRLRNNHYAINNAFQRLKDAVDSNIDVDIYVATGEMLLWIMTTSEWHLEHNEGYRQRRNKDKKGQLLFGLLHSYNLMKHNMEFITLHQKEGGFSFPFSFPVVFPPITVHWAKAGDLLVGKFESQKENYVKYIEGKEIIDTFKDVLFFLNQEKARYEQKKAVDNNETR